MSSGTTYPKMGSKAQLWRLLIGFEWAMWEGTVNTCLFQLKINRFSPFSLLQRQKMKHYPINNRNFLGAKLYPLDEATWSPLIERETQEGKRRRESAENNGERASHANAGFWQVRVPCVARRVTLWRRKFSDGHGQRSAASEGLGEEGQGWFERDNESETSEFQKDGKLCCAGRLGL